MEPFEVWHLLRKSADLFPARPESLGVESVASAAQRRVENVRRHHGQKAAGRGLHHALVSGVDDKGTILRALVTFLWIVDFECAIEGLGRAQLFFCDLVTNRAGDSVFGG